MYRVVEIPGGGGNSGREVNRHLEKALVELGKAMHYAEAQKDEGYYGDRSPMYSGQSMPMMPGRFMDGMNMRDGRDMEDMRMNMRQPDGEHSEEYLRGWNDHAQMMNMRRRASMMGGNY